MAKTRMDISRPFWVSSGGPKDNSLKNQNKVDIISEPIQVFLFLISFFFQFFIVIFIWKNAFEMLKMFCVYFQFLLFGW